MLLLPHCPWGLDTPGLSDSAGNVTQGFKHAWLILCQLSPGPFLSPTGDNLCHLRSGVRGLQDGRAEVHPGPYSQLPVGRLVECCALPVATQLLSLLHKVGQVLSLSADRCRTVTGQRPTSAGSSLSQDPEAGQEPPLPETSIILCGAMWTLPRLLWCSW